MKTMLAWHYRRLAEKLQMFIAWRCPKWLVKWCAIRLMAHATQGQYSNQEVPALTAMDALNRWPA
jgi:hypothetical protein